MVGRPELTVAARDTTRRDGGQFVGYARASCRSLSKSPGKTWQGSNSWIFGGQGGGTVEVEGESLPPGTTRSDDFFAVLYDPWALNHLTTILPDDGQREGHPLYKRVRHY